MSTLKKSKNIYIPKSKEHKVSKTSKHNIYVASSDTFDHIKVYGLRKDDDGNTVLFESK